MVSIILAKKKTQAVGSTSLCGMVSVLGGKLGSVGWVFFSLLFLASKNDNSRASKIAKGWYNVAKKRKKYLLHTQGKEKNGRAN